MKETGMVRRLDDLGRLVIPKEIRRKYKMKEGDSIEIYLDNDTICIRKFEETSKYYEQINLMCEILNDHYKNIVFFNSEEYLDKHELKIEDKFLEKTQIHRVSFFQHAKIFKDNEQRYSGCIFPVVLDGNYFASFVMIFNIREYKEQDLEELKLYSYLLSRELG